MAVSEIRFDIELDSYKSFVDKRIEDLGEKWQQLAKDILEETSDKRTEGVKKLKVITISNCSVVKINKGFFFSNFFVLNNVGKSQGSQHRLAISK